RTVADTYELPDEVRRIATELIRAIEDLRRRNALAQQLLAKADRLGLLKTPGQILHELSGYEGEGIGKLLNGLPSVLAKAIADLNEGLQTVQGPQVELYAWWNRYCKRRLPAKRFKKTRDDWIHVVGKDERVIKEEFNVVLRALRSLPIST